MSESSKKCYSNPLTKCRYIIKAHSQRLKTFARYGSGKGEKKTDTFQNLNENS